MRSTAVVWLFFSVVLFLLSSQSIQTLGDEILSEGEGVLNADLKAEKVPLKTDDDVATREARSISGPAAYSEEEKSQMEKAKEKFAFQAEVNEVMKILIHFLYSNKEVFLRELISNASDALDKIRVYSLTNPNVLDTKPEMTIRIFADPETNTLSITDTGIGMTKEDLVNNLGTIAQSGTRAFAAAMAQADSNLIGQFGVGFYSAFLVADKVTVTTKHNDDKQYIWESTADGSFTITEDPKGDTLGRGTRITLHLYNDFEADRERASECQTFLDQNTLRRLVAKYSEFIDFPIFLWASHEEDREVEVDEDDEEGDEEEDLDEEDFDEEEEESSKKTKTVTETVWSWERLNENRPIWTREKDSISEEEYYNFYKAITKDTEEPLAYNHFVAEGDVEFKSILYLPNKPPLGQFDPTTPQRGIKLYVRRVFITDDFETVIPKYLGFVKGVVDSDDLPLNISREMLQENKLLEVIKKKVVRKAIAMFQELVTDEEKYSTFWKNYSTNIKYGVIEDVQNRSRLAKLLRFVSSKTGELTSFDDYISRMKDGQEQIYYLSGENTESLKNSPLLEKLLTRGYEVLFMTDPIDEYTMSNLNKYDSKYLLTNVAKGDLKLPEDEEEDNKEDDEVDHNTRLQPLKTFIKDNFSDKVTRVTISNRLTKSPFALVSESWGYSAAMEKVIKAQALSTDSSSRRFMPKPVLEVNPNHPIVIELNRLVEENQDEDGNNEAVRHTVSLLLETASLASGYDLEDPTNFVQLIHSMVQRDLNVEVPQQPQEPQGAAEEDDHRDEL